MRKINKIDKFYDDREVLEKLEDRLQNRSLFSINIDQSAQNTSLTINSPYVMDDLDIVHQRRIYYKLKELLQGVRCDVSIKIVKELKRDLEEEKKEIRKDFDLGGKEKDV